MKDMTRYVAVTAMAVSLACMAGGCKSMLPAESTRAALDETRELIRTTVADPETVENDQYDRSAHVPTLWDAASSSRAGASLQRRSRS